MNKRVSRIIRQVHQRIPVRVRKSYGFIIRFVKKIGNYILPLYHFSIKERESDELLSMVYIGREKELLYYWLRKLSDDFEISPGRKYIHSSRVSRYINSMYNEVDLVIMEAGKNAPSNAYPRGFLLPRWMEMKLDFETFKGKSRTKNIRRNIKKFALTYEVRQGSEDFELFYHKMYVPFVKMRHQESADISDYVHFKSRFKKENALIFFVIHEGAPVAGAYIEEREGIHRLATFGILNGSAEIYRMGVLGALYGFVVDYLEQRGEKEIFMGNSLPVITDGVTKFKTQLGAEPYLPGVHQRESFYFLPMSARLPMISLLKTNPLYYLWNEELRSAFFLDASDFNSREEFLDFVRRQSSHPDIQMKIYCFDSPEKLEEWLGPKEMAKAEIHKYDKDIFINEIHQLKP